MELHFSKFFCNRIRQDGTILPRNSKIQIILLFLSFWYCKMQDLRSFQGLCPLDPHQRTVLPVLAGGLTAPPDPSCSGLGNDLRSMHRPGQHFFIYILAGSYDFCRVVTAGVLTFFGSKNDSAPALLYSKYCTAPNVPGYDKFL